MNEMSYPQFAYIFMVSIFGFFAVWGVIMGIGYIYNQFAEFFRFVESVNDE